MSSDYLQIAPSSKHSNSQIISCYIAETSSTLRILQTCLVILAKGTVLGLLHLPTSSDLPSQLCISNLFLGATRFLCFLLVTCPSTLGVLSNLPAKWGSNLSAQCSSRVQTTVRGFMVNTAFPLDVVLICPQRKKDVN